MLLTLVCAESHLSRSPRVSNANFWGLVSECTATSVPSSVAWYLTPFRVSSKVVAPVATAPLSCFSSSSSTVRCDTLPPPKRPIEAFLTVSITLSMCATRACSRSISAISCCVTSLFIPPGPARAFLYPRSVPESRPRIT